MYKENSMFLGRTALITSVVGVVLGVLFAMLLPVAQLVGQLYPGSPEYAAMTARLVVGLLAAGTFIGCQIMALLLGLLGMRTGQGIFAIVFSACMLVFAGFGVFCVMDMFQIV